MSTTPWKRSGVEV